MKIALVSLDWGYRGVDLTDPRAGNPGMGGTDFLFGALAYELAQQPGFEVTLLCTPDRVTYHPSIATHGIDLGDPDVTAAWLRANRFDAIILRGGGGDRLAPALIPLLPASARVVVWTHNFIGRRLLKRLHAAPQVRAIVSVGAEQHALQEHLFRTPKALAIANFVYPSERAECAVERPRRAVYVGALIPTKGFHYLARHWPAIRQQVPDAGLDVIGSGALYSDQNQLGPRGLAAADFEQQILRLLGREPEELGVVFHGRVADPDRKQQILQGARLGIPNPTGVTETFCLSAIEMTLAGCWAVAPERWGFCDTVQAGVTGTYFNTDSEFIDHCVAALTEYRFDAAGHRRATEAILAAFDHSVIVPQWMQLLQAIERGDTALPGGGNGGIRGRYPLAWRFKLPSLLGLTPWLSAVGDRRYRRYLRR